MAGVSLKFNTVPIATGTGAQTLVQWLAASNHAVLFKRFSISFAGTTNTNAPVKVQLIRQTTAGSGGTGSGTNSFLVKDPDDQGETIQTTQIDTPTTEPTSGDVLHTWYVHPQGGFLEWRADGIVNKPIKIGGGDRLGLVVTAANDVNCVAEGDIEE